MEWHHLLITPDHGKVIILFHHDLCNSHCSSCSSKTKCSVRILILKFQVVWIHQSHHLLNKVSAFCCSCNVENSVQVSCDAYTNGCWVYFKNTSCSFPVAFQCSLIKGYAYIEIEGSVSCLCLKNQYATYINSDSQRGGLLRFKDWISLEK